VTNEHCDEIIDCSFVDGKTIKEHHQQKFDSMLHLIEMAYTKNDLDAFKKLKMEKPYSILACVLLMPLDKIRLQKCTDVYSNIIPHETIIHSLKIDYLFSKVLQYTQSNFMEDDISDIDQQFIVGDYTSKFKIKSFLMHFDFPFKNLRSDMVEFLVKEKLIHSHSMIWLMCNWMKREQFLFHVYHEKFLNFIVCWNHLQMISLDDHMDGICEFHMVFVKKVFEQMRKVDLKTCFIKRFVYDTFKTEETLGCSIIDDSFRKSKMNVFNEVKAWGGRYPVSGFIRGFTNISKMIEQIEKCNNDFYHFRKESFSRVMDFYEEFCNSQMQMLQVKQENDFLNEEYYDDDIEE